MTDTEFNAARMDQYYQNVDYNRAYARASKKRWRKAKKLGVEPSSLGPVENFFDTEIEKPKKTEMPEELKQHKRAQYYKYKTARKNNVNPTDLGDTSNFYHTEHRRYNKHGIRATKGKAYYDKWHYKTYGEELKLKDMAEYYADVEASRAYKRMTNSRFRKAHKNDKKKTWRQKIFLYIRKLGKELR